MNYISSFHLPSLLPVMINQYEYNRSAWLERRVKVYMTSTDGGRGLGATRRFHQSVIFIIRGQSLQYSSNQYTVHQEQNMATNSGPGRLRVSCRKGLL